MSVGGLDGGDGGARTVLALGRASRGRDKRAPMLDEEECHSLSLKTIFDPDAGDGMIINCLEVLEDEDGMAGGEAAEVRRLRHVPGI